MKSFSGAEKPTRPNAAEQFDEIAFLYDDLMTGVPYNDWVKYIRSIVQHFGADPKSVLDLCCGTGRFSLFLAKAGYNVAGVDISAEMIEIARSHSSLENIDIEFHVQDASCLKLERDFDLVVSLFDSLNYILKPEALERAFRRVERHLKPGGMFIFDMNTEYALAAGFFDQSDLGALPGLQYCWRSSYDPGSRICEILMTFQVDRQGENRSVELRHYQRAYGILEVVELLQNAGLSVLAVYEAYTFRKGTEKNDRVYFVARK
jgi:ubiquinone/menaquinone biosynthesis C-methylase UbiE